LRACKELGIPVSYSIKDFTGKPLDELKYLVSVNLHRRHLDEFQRAEIALKYDKLYRRIARDKWASTKYTSESGTEAASKRWASGNGDEHDPTDDAAVDNDGGDSDDITKCGPYPRMGAVSATREAIPERNWLSSSAYLALHSTWLVPS
jgi:hypothetical protein